MSVASFDRALEKLSLQDYKRHSVNSLRWLRNYVLKNLKGSWNNVTKSGNVVSRFTLGGMYTYIYDPKTKEQMPYWDIHPLIIFLKPAKTPGNFYGLNVHYLMPKTRQTLFHELSFTLNNTKLDETTKIRVNYEKLMTFSVAKHINQAVKQYSISQLRSPIIKVDPNYWDILLYLPFDAFEQNIGYYEKRRRNRSKQ